MASLKLIIHTISTSADPSTPRITEFCNSFREAVEQSVTTDVDADAQEMVGMSMFLLDRVEDLIMNNNIAGIKELSSSSLFKPLITANVDFGEIICEVDLSEEINPPAPVLELQQAAIKVSQC